MQQLFFTLIIVGFSVSNFIIVLKENCGVVLREIINYKFKYELDIVG